ncbi:MAG TPA: AAA family ATPase [Phycisphaerae bacterium]|nr:AAA family ATPase [Phycisphaerae bacterium]
MSSCLKSITIRGFKSIQKLDRFDLSDLNVLIGANGAGKSNLVDFFRMLRAMADEGFQKFVNQQGGGDGFFFLGPQQTRQISSRLEFGSNVYEFDLEPTADGSIQIADERVQYTGGYGLGMLRSIGKGLRESNLRTRKNDPARMGQGQGVPGYVYDAVSSWTVYHFHDTGLLAPMRREQSAGDFEQLRPDASNIAAFLWKLRHEHKQSYELVRDTVRLIAPFFDDFLFRSREKAGDEKLKLEWRQKGSDYPFQPSNLSDGTIRFICLATALLQPTPPSAVVIDEPELGLHPFAITLIAELIQSAAAKTQVLISTQSPTLLDHFQPKDIVVVNRDGGSSTFDRLDETELTEWLREYSVGELWQKNVVRGGPSHE